MVKSKARLSMGFTTLEVLIVIVVVSLLAMLTFNLIGDAQARGRDNQRVADIDTLHSRLEEYFSDNGGYPDTLNTTLFPGLDSTVLQDPDNVSITIVSPVADQYAALQVSNPTTTANYEYIPYPTGCNTISCTGYVLKSYIEQPSSSVPNPYVRYGLNNN